MRLASFGDGAWRFAVPPGTNIVALAEYLRALPGVEDAVVTETFACVFADQEPEAPDLGSIAPIATPNPNARVYTIRVRYDGMDLEDVASRIGIGSEAFIHFHLHAEYNVSFLGFMPGFAYLRGLPDALALPRRATPRPRVPAGSVGIAGGYAGVYPYASSGGWHIIGTAIDCTLWTDQGATLHPGDRVKFERVS